MKRFFIVAVFCTVGVLTTSAQEMQKGSSLINVGLGLIDGRSYDSGAGLNVAYDYGLVDTWGPGIFTIGGFIGFSTWQKYDFRTTKWGITPRVAYRYPINNTFDVYGTAMLGINLWTYSNTDYITRKELFASSIGLRYTFGSNVGIFAEYGVFGCVSLLNGGLSFSF